MNHVRSFVDDGSRFRDEDFIQLELRHQNNLLFVNYVLMNGI